ncbi:MAG: hypothetical protein KF681_17395 [Bdellovibrionaceae bacterium]|nr:hypothetical protein [Pseudobdellovibrionaceae bacterium]
MKSALSLKIKIGLALVVAMIAFAVWLVLHAPKSHVMTEIPPVLPQDPTKVRPPPPLPERPDEKAPVNTEMKLVPPRKDLPPPPPVPDLKKVLKAPINKDMKLLPARKDLPPAPPLPPVQFPETNQ